MSFGVALGLARLWLGFVVKDVELSQIGGEDVLIAGSCVGQAEDGKTGDLEYVQIRFQDREAFQVVHCPGKYCRRRDAANYQYMPGSRFRGWH